VNFWPRAQSKPFLEAIIYEKPHSSVEQYNGHITTSIKTRMTKFSIVCQESHVAVSILSVLVCSVQFFFIWRNSSQWARGSSFTRFLDHTQRPTTVGRNSLDEWSARRWDIYLTTHNTQRQTNIHAPRGIRTRNLSWRAAAYLRLRTRGHWDRRSVHFS